MEKVDKKRENWQIAIMNMNWKISGEAKREIASKMAKEKMCSNSTWSLSLTKFNLILSYDVHLALNWCPRFGFCLVLKRICPFSGFICLASKYNSYLSTYSRIGQATSHRYTHSYISPAVLITLDRRGTTKQKLSLWRTEWYFVKRFLF